MTKTVFLSYAHQDEALKDQLIAHLAMLRNDRLLATWNDRQIPPGGVIDQEIAQQLARADIVLLLVSADFLNSTYCYEIELTHAMQRHANGDVKVVPIILRECDWHSAPFGTLAALPKDGLAVTRHASHDEAFTYVAMRLRKMLLAEGAVSKLGSPTTGTEVPEINSVPNTRFPRAFSDVQKDDFVQVAFETILEYFTKAVAAVELENPGMKAKVRKRNEEEFVVIIYREGDRVAGCSIRVGSEWGGRERHILYSDSEASPARSFNESLSVHVAQHDLLLKPMMGGLRGNTQPMATAAAAEHLWKMLTERLGY